MIVYDKKRGIFLKYFFICNYFYFYVGEAFTIDFRETLPKDFNASEGNFYKFK